jgi:tetratricopeptide (TPR) repeat protein
MTGQHGETKSQIDRQFPCRNLVLHLDSNNPVISCFPQEELVDTFNQAIQNSPQFDDAFKYRGLANRRQGNNSQAIQDWEKAAQFYKANNSTRDYQILRGWLKDLGVNI